MATPVKRVDLRDPRLAAGIAAALVISCALLLYSGVGAHPVNGDSTLELLILLLSLAGLLRLAFVASAAHSPNDARPGLNARMRAAFNALPAFIMCTDAAGEPFFVNEGALRFLGMSEDEVRRAKYDFVHPEDRPRVESAWTHSVTSGAAYQGTQRLRAADGTYRWFQVRGEPLRDDRGRIEHWYGVWTDVDERMRAEQTLRETLDAIPALVWSAAPDGTPLYLNKRVLDFTGTKLERHCDYDWTSTLHPEDIARTRELLVKSLRTGEPLRVLHRLRRHDGEYRWMDAHADSLRDAAGSVVCWYGIDFDVHDRVQLQEANKQAQSRLAKASEVAMVAEISASLAHEINQPLAAITSNAHACERWLMAEPPNLARARLTADRVRRDALSAADLVERIRRLFRHASPTRVPLELNAAIQASLDLLAERFEADQVETDVDLALQLPLTPADPIQLQQVLVNLLTNAVEAVAARIDVQRRVSVRSLRSDTSEVRVEIHDNGPGLVDAVRIFEPFFTTKPNGMGMGLAICRSIVEAHGGQLSAHAHPEGGSTFRLDLPFEVESP